MSEPRAHQVKRLHMRSMRRGIKEMDLILSAFAAQHLTEMSDETLSLYDLMLNENDHDLYQWVTGQVAPDSQYAALIAQIREQLERHKAVQT